MENIILDTGILLREPRVLGLEIPDIKFLIPLAVVEELIERTRQTEEKFDGRVELIQKAAHQGTVTILNLEELDIKQFRDHYNLRKLSKADISIVAIATSLKNKGEKVTIATLDRDIVKFAKDNNIGILSEVDASHLYSKFIKPPVENETIQSEIVSYENKEKQNLRTGIFIGVFSTLFTILIYKYIELIISTLKIWGTITIILLTGVGLYIFREKQRFAYGVFEFLVGVVAIIYLFVPNGFDYNTIKFNLEFAIKLIGGLYIMVRGQDNIVKALQNKKLGLILKDKFGIGG